MPKAPETATESQQMIREEIEQIEKAEDAVDRKTKIKNFLVENQKDIFRILLILAIVIFIISDYQNLSNLNIRELLASRHTPAGSWAMVLFIYFIKGLVMVIPAAVVYISVGMSFKVWTALILNTVGMIVELLASYFLGRFLSVDYIQNLLEDSKYKNRIKEMGSKKSSAAMFMLRFVPIFPVDIISLFYGSVRYPFWKYMGWSMAGIMPRVILFTILGKKIYDWFPDLSAKLIMYIILFILVASFIGGMVVHFRKKHKKKQKIKELTPTDPFYASAYDASGYRIVKTAIPARKEEEKHERK